MIKTVRNPYDSIGSVVELDEPGKPFNSERAISRRIDSLKNAISGIDCFFDASIPLGYPLRYVMLKEGPRDPRQYELFSEFYKQFNPLFMQENVRITSCVKHALIRLIFHGRLVLFREDAPEAKALDRQLDMLHRAVNRKSAHPRGSLSIGLEKELDDELVSTVYQIASKREDIIGLASRSRAQTVTLKKIAERFSSEGNPLPIELIMSNPESGEYERDSLYRTVDLISAMPRE